MNLSIYSFKNTMLVLLWHKFLTRYAASYNYWHYLQFITQGRTA